MSDQRDWRYISDGQVSEDGETWYPWRDGRAVIELWEPCDCCDRMDLDTGHGLCGFGWTCPPCLTAELTGVQDYEHFRRHFGRIKSRYMVWRWTIDALGIGGKG